MNGLLAKFEGIPQELLDYISKLEARILKLENMVKATWPQYSDALIEEGVMI